MHLKERLEWNRNTEAWGGLEKAVVEGGTPLVNDLSEQQEEECKAIYLLAQTPEGSV